MQLEYVMPVFQQKAFHCPFCNVYANQLWSSLYTENDYNAFQYADAAQCAHCKRFTIWYMAGMIYPDLSGVQPPNQDLSPEIQADYQEAASILQKSPRGAAALLRLAIQKLCKDLGESGKDINDDIKHLVAKGLPVMVQKSLDAVRVIGNDAVHPGQIDLRDDLDSAKVLFKLVNLVAEKMVTEPKVVEEIYGGLPEAKKEQIEKRDGIIK